MFRFFIPFSERTHIDNGRRIDIFTAQKPHAQLFGVLISWGLAIVGTLMMLKVTDSLVGVRVSGEHEVRGLDLSQHGEVGYDFESWRRL